MTAALRDFLAMAETRAFEWGSWDCCLWLGDWGLALTGIDGAAPWRGRYRTALGCKRLLKREGGVRVVVERGALAVGMKPVQEAEAGAVGVVQAILPDASLAEVGAVFTGRRWALLAHPAGLLACTAAPVAMWSL